MQSNQFSFNAALALSNGEFLFGGIKGFNVFEPGKIYTKDVTPKIFLAGLRINNTPIEDHASLVKQRVYEQIQKIVVPYDQAILALDYLALDYTDASNIGYAYRLKGWDKAWNYVSGIRTANYSRLQEGSYSFEVKLSNKRGIWSEPQTLLQIIICPPGIAPGGHMGFTLFSWQVCFTCTLSTKTGKPVCSTKYKWPTWKCRKKKS